MGEVYVRLGCIVTRRPVHLLTVGLLDVRILTEGPANQATAQAGGRPLDGRTMPAAGRPHESLINRTKTRMNGGYAGVDQTSSHLSSERAC